MGPGTRKKDEIEKKEGRKEGRKDYRKKERKKKERKKEIKKKERKKERSSQDRRVSFIPNEIIATQSPPSEHEEIKKNKATIIVYCSKKLVQ